MLQRVQHFVLDLLGHVPHLGRQLVHEIDRELAQEYDVLVLVLVQPQGLKQEPVGLVDGVVEAGEELADGLSDMLDFADADDVPVGFGAEQVV